MELSTQSVLAISALLASTCFLSRIVLVNRDRAFRIAVVAGLFAAAFAVFIQSFGLKAASAIMILSLAMAAVAMALATSMVMTRKEPRHRAY